MSDTTGIRVFFVIHACLIAVILASEFPAVSEPPTRMQDWEGGAGKRGGAGGRQPPHVTTLSSEYLIPSRPWMIPATYLHGSMLWWIQPPCIQKLLSPLSSVILSMHDAWYRYQNILCDTGMRRRCLLRIAYTSHLIVKMNLSTVCFLRLFLEKKMASRRGWLSRRLYFSLTVEMNNENVCIFIFRDFFVHVASKAQMVSQMNVRYTPRV